MSPKTSKKDTAPTLIREILQVSSSSALIKITGISVEFISSIIIARLLGAEQYGLYVYTLIILTAASSLSTIGYDTASLRFIPEYKVIQKWHFLNGYIHTALTNTLLASIITAGFIPVIAIFLAQSNNTLAPSLSSAPLLLPLLAISRIRQHLLRAFKYVIRAEILDIIARPLLIGFFLTCYTVLGKVAITADTAITVYILITLLTTIVGIVWLYNRIPNKKNFALRSYEKKKWRKVALPLLFFSSMQLITGYADTIMLGILSSYTTSGVYSIAVRLSGLVGFSLLAINMVLAPTISELFYSDKLDKLQQVITSTTRKASFLAAITCILLIITGKLILTFYGNPYGEAYIPLLFLIPGQLLNVCCGSVGIILSVTGHHNYTVKVMVLTALINIIANYILIPVYGMCGAATSTTFSIIIWNIIMARYIIKHLKIQPTILRQ